MPETNDAAAALAFNIDKLDWLHPDYAPVLAQRRARIEKLRTLTPENIVLLKSYYADHIADFINDWGWTTDPRNPERGLPTLVPFILFPKQREWIEWIIDHWRRGRPGLTEKSRDMGVSWIAVATAASMCLLMRGVAIGFGSRKQEYVDQGGSPKSLFWKAREFIKSLPPEFTGSWSAHRHAPHMRILFPDTGSVISGEAGDNIGRGDRASIYVVDEAAHLERPELVEASLSQTTNCRIDVSSVNGMGNPFAIKRHSGKIDVFTFHWRDDPRKDEAWYAQKCDELDPVTVAQEIDINYLASIEGVLIPSAWVQAAIDAHVALGFEASGIRRAGFDVADEGKDKNAVALRHGPVLLHLEEWSGFGLDIYETVTKAVWLSEEHDAEEIIYDADGLGAGVRGDAKRVVSQRPRKVRVTAYRGSGEILHPHDEDIKGRKNIDTFRNAKAQNYWRLRTRFQNTWRAVKKKIMSAPEDMISIPKDIALRDKLVSELAQITYKLDDAGKFVINKKPNGALSPNLADAVNMAFSPVQRVKMTIDEEAFVAPRPGMTATSTGSSKYARALNAFTAR